MGESHSFTYIKLRTPKRDERRWECLEKLKYIKAQRVEKWNPWIVASNMVNANNVRVGRVWTSSSEPKSLLQ